MTKKILLVDDLLFDRMLTQRALQDCKVEHDIVAVDDGVEALSQLKHNKYDLVLLDLKMPRVDGFEVLKRVQNTPSLSGIPIIVLSGSDLEADRVRANVLGASSYVHKAVDFAEFKQNLQHTLSLYGQC